LVIDSGALSRWSTLQPLRAAADVSSEYCGNLTRSGSFCTFLSCTLNAHQLFALVSNLGFRNICPIVDNRSRSYCLHCSFLVAWGATLYALSSRVNKEQRTTMCTCSEQDQPGAQQNKRKRRLVWSNAATSLMLAVAPVVVPNWGVERHGMAD